jgi:hypothetical protein
MYYGAADSCTSPATAKLDEVPALLVDWHLRNVSIQGQIDGHRLRNTIFHLHVCFVRVFRQGWRNQLDNKESSRLAGIPYLSFPRRRESTLRPIRHFNFWVWLRPEAAQGVLVLLFLYVFGIPFLLQPYQLVNVPNNFQPKAIVAPNKNKKSRKIFYSFLNKYLWQICGMYFCNISIQTRMSGQL